MGIKFDVKIYNHSDKVIDFELIDSNCMYLPQIDAIRAKPKEWVVFKNVETKKSFKSACFLQAQELQVAAKYNGHVLGSTKYDISDNQSKMYWYATGNIVDNSYNQGCGVISKGIDFGSTTTALIFERIDSYGDLFFSGRDLFKDNSCKSDVWTVAEALSAEHEKFPSALVNNRSRIDTNRNDEGFLEVVTGLVQFAGKAGKLWGDVKPFDAGKPLPGTFKESFFSALPLVHKRATDFYAAYSQIVKESEEITILAHDLSAVPTFHVVFTDALINAPDIISGNFDLPEPPDNHDTFWASVRPNGARPPVSVAAE